MAEPNLASNNPFRRRPTIPQPPVEADAGSTPSPVPAASPSPQPSGDDFRRALTALPKSSEAPPSTTFQKPKPVKRVRVQSPPPSSPDSTEAEFEARFPASGHVQPPRHDENDSSSTSSSESESEAGEDPFRSTRPGAETEISGTSFPSSAARQRPPLNPFGRTLQDIEQGSGEAASDAVRSPGATAGKASLDVDSFRRLLMTGQSGGATAAPAVLGSGTHQTLQPPGPAGDAGSFTDASSISKQSIFEANQNPQETPRTSHEISEAEDDRRGLLLHTPSASSERTTLRKKPPPPSSRHGKLIKSPPKPDVAEPSRESTPRPTTKQLDDPASSTGQARRTSSSSDLNKPLPLPPQRPSVDGERESVFDKEAAGKVPEVDVDPDAPEEDIPSPRPPTPPNASHSTSGPVTATPAMAKPAPPPRRQAHYKPDPKASSTTSTAHEHPSPFPVDDEAAPPRSSMDSTHSRSSSFKANFSAPPPPPSRRSGHASKPSTSLVSPSVTSFASSISSPAILSDSERGQLGYSRAQGPTFEASSPPAAQTDGSAPDPISPPPQEKPSRPPPPPARHVSVRHKEHHRQPDHFSATPGRPPSVVSVEAPTPPASRAGGIPPPPPPRPRQRGTSRGSTEVPDVIGRKSIDSVSSANRVRIADAEEGNGDGGGQHHHKGAVTEEQASVAGASGTGLEDRRDSHANDILADLDKLRREVDALRGAL